MKNHQHRKLQITWPLDAHRVLNANNTNTRSVAWMWIKPNNHHHHHQPQPSEARNCRRTTNTCLQQKEKQHSSTNARTNTYILFFASCTVFSSVNCPPHLFDAGGHQLTLSLSFYISLTRSVAVLFPSGMGALC